MAELKRPEPPLDIPRAPPRVPEPRTWAPPQQQRPAYGGYYDQRPRASSFDDRRARLPSDLSDGVTESSYASDTPWGYQQPPPRPSPAEFADRGAASLLATLDAPAWTPQQRQRPAPRPDTELASDLRQLGLADPPRPPRPQVPDPSPPWLAGMLDEAPPSQPLGAFDRPPAREQPPPPPPGLTEASEPTWASAATRPAGAPPLPRPRASSVSSSVASDGASALDRIALKVVPVRFAASEPFTRSARRDVAHARRREPGRARYRRGAREHGVSEHESRRRRRGSRQSVGEQDGPAIVPSGRARERRIATQAHNNKSKQKRRSTSRRRPGSRRRTYLLEEPRPSSSSAPIRKVPSRPGMLPLYKSSNGEEKRESARNAATIVGSRCDRATAAASS